MLRLTVFLLGGVLAVGCQAQLQLTPRPQATVSNPAMVINEHGAAVELLPTLRATPIASGAAEAQSQRFYTASAETKFTKTSMGVVFNHAMQVRGTLTGEISFKMKGTLQATPEEFPTAEYPALGKLTNPNVFIVVATTPAEYIAVYNRLRGRSDVEWVEAIVDYSGSVAAPAGTK